LQKDIVTDYLACIGQGTVDKTKFEVVEILESYPIDRVNELENRTV